MRLDELTLLSGVSAKQRAHLRAKGIFTITQLSYTFRPRRRGKRHQAKREKYHPALRALAIRDKKIYMPQRGRLIVAKVNKVMPRKLGDVAQELTDADASGC
jgi:hypothetical protein